MKSAQMLLAATILAVAWPAAGQVTRSQYGRALDANFLIGSGGINNINPQQYLPGNLYINGQVTRGRHFRGVVGYSGANQLSLALPSAGLDDFRRDTYGLDQLGVGTSYAPSAYFSNSRTVLRTRAIDYRLNAPGSSTPRVSYVSAQQTQQLFDRTVQAYQPIVSDMGSALLVDSRVYRPVMIARAARESLIGDEPDDLGVVRPVASSLFGIIRAEEHRRLAAELSEAERARKDRIIDASVDAAIDATVPGAQPVAGKPLPTPTVPAGMSTGYGQDVYHDLQQLMRQALEEAAIRAQAGDDPPEPGRGRRVRVPLPFEEYDDSAPIHLRRSALRRGQRGLVVSRFAGASRDLFNLHMLQAEKLLAKGKYYDAAERYRIANALNPANPLATMGLSLALFGADESLSAGLQLRRSLKRFYLAIDMMNTTVDVRGLLGEASVNKRIGQLEARITRQSDEVDPSLLLLAAFIRESMGDHDKAVGHAKLLKSLAGEVIIYRGYAEYLLTSPVGPTPATQPAK